MKQTHLTNYPIELMMWLGWSPTQVLLGFFTTVDGLVALLAMVGINNRLQQDVNDSAIVFKKQLLLTLFVAITVKFDVCLTCNSSDNCLYIFKAVRIFHLWLSNCYSDFIGWCSCCEMAVWIHFFTTKVSHKSVSFFCKSPLQAQHTLCVYFMAYLHFKQTLCLWLNFWSTTIMSTISVNENSLYSLNAFVRIPKCLIMKSFLWLEKVGYVHQMFLISDMKASSISGLNIHFEGKFHCAG